MPLFVYDYSGFSFTLSIPSYWNTIYNGKAHEDLYSCYTILLDYLRLVPKDKIVLDIGVNNGIFAVPANMLGYKVVGFEPVKSNYNNIREAQRLNDLIHFDIYNLALSNENIEKIIYVPECPDNASFSQIAAIANMTGKQYEAESVIAVRFDDWIKTHPEYENIGFIKIDTQGAEYNVLEGMKEFLTNAKDIYLAVEYESHLNTMGYSFEQLDELILSFGFYDLGNVTGGDKLFKK